MSITAQPGRPVGLLDITATIAILGGLVWVAARNTRDRRNICRRLDAAVREVDEKGYCRGYVDGIGREAPARPRRLRPVE